MSKFTFDADAVIGLNNIGYLDDILELLQKNGDSIYMSEENFYEVDIKPRDKIKKVAKDIIKGKGEDFQKFRERLADKGIIISGKDKYVPYIAEQTESDYIVTFDTILTRKANDYKNIYNRNYMTPISTIGLLKYLYESEVLSYQKYMKIGLKYFKYEGLSNIYEGVSEHNWDIEAVRDKFQLYKDPIVESIEKLIIQRRIDIR